METRKLTKSMVFAALFAALISVCAFVSVPVPGTPIPIVLQNMMVVLSGLLMGPVLGTASTLLFIVAGLLGLPIFSGGTGGLAKLMGPTGGFIVGYAFAALVAGLVSGRPRMGRRTSVFRVAVASVLGFSVMYIPGVIHFMRSLDKTFAETMVLCVTPYIPGDLAKMVLSIVVAMPLRRTVAAFVFQDEGDAR